MRLRGFVRLLFGLSALSLLALGVWQCARDTTAPGSGALSLRLQTLNFGSEEIDSVEIEVQRGGTVAALDTVPVLEDGSFSATFAVPSGGPYRVEVYARGAGSALLPDSTVQGVLGFGLETDIELRPGRLSDVTITVEEGRSTIDTLIGQTGSRSLEIRWHRVSGATAYNLGWFVGQTTQAGYETGITDTLIQLDWDGPVGLALRAAGEDTLHFAVQPLFGPREGVYGETWPGFLATWMSLPGLLSLSPAHGEVVALGDAMVEVQFDRPMDPDSVAAGLFWEVADSGVPISYELLSVGPGDDSDFLLLPDAGALQMGEDYRVRLTPRMADQEGRPFDAGPDQEGLQSAMVVWSIEPYSPLRMIDMDPEPDSDDLDPEQTIRLILNRRIDFSTLSDSAVFVTAPGGERIPGLRDTAETAHIVTWRPSAPLWYDTTYLVNVNSRLVDVDGVAFDQDELTYPDLEPLEAPLTTVSQPFGPRVAVVSPETGSQAVWTNQRISVTFNTVVDSSTVVANQSFWLKRNGTVAVSGSVHKVDGEEGTYVFTPASSLQRNTGYVVEVTPDVLNLNGIPLDQNREEDGYQSFVADFHTENPPSVSSADPPAGATGVPVDEPLRLTFSGDLDPASVTAQTVRLFGGGMVPIECARDFAAPNEVTLTPAAPLAYLGTYLVSVDTLVTAVDGSLFDQETASGRQLYEAFFWTEPESLHPKVSAVYPALAATDIAITDSIVVWFDMPVRLGTVDEDTYLLTRTSGNGAPESVSADSIRVTPDSLKATFYPAGVLDHGSDYEIEVTTEVLEYGGFGLDQDPFAEGLQSFVSSFSTVNETTPPRVIYVDPGNGETGVALDETLVLQFSEAMDSASVAEAFSLRAGETPIEGLGILDVTRRFWTFEPAPELVFGTLYTVMVDTLCFDLAGNFLDQDVVSSGLQPFESVFTTVTDDTQPMVLGMDPEVGDTLDVTVTLRVEFNEAILPSSAQAEGAFTVAIAGEPIHSGTITFEENDTVLVWTPDAALEFSSLYYVTANPAITDIYGNALDQQPGTPGDQLWLGYFWTRAETVPPTVIALLLDDPVLLTVAPTLVFSEPVDTLSLDGAISLTNYAGAVGFERRIAASADSVSLLLTNPLVQGTLYTVTVDTLVVDTLGNALDCEPDTPGNQPYEEDFLTETDDEPPVLETLTPADGAAHVQPDVTVFLGFSEPLDSTTVSDANIYMTGPGGQIALTIAADAWFQNFTLIPDEPFVGGATYGIHVSSHVRDLGHWQFDADPDLPGNQDLDAEFLVGRDPQIVWVGGVCATGDSASVTFDARDSFDPDSLLADSVATVTWDWGDGEVESLSAPDGLLAIHDYGFQDVAGCDGLDNDGDGSVDEDGESGCDESYHVILEITDAHGFSDRDTSGVSFCAFLAIGSDPAEGAEQVGPDEDVRVTLTRPVDQGSVTTETVLFTTEGGGQSIAFTPGFDEDDYVLVLDPDSDLSAGGYTVTLTGGLTDIHGARLDQIPETAEEDPFELGFSVNSPPVIGWDGGQCVLGDTSRVTFDASDSEDPDSGDAIAWAVWIWGDGEQDSLAAPAGLVAEHEFPYQDTGGCDGLDNDDDGEPDETGADGCDESYEVILRVYDTMGASVADTAGVSFCAFVVLESDPVQGQTNFQPADSLRITFTRPLDPGSISEDSVTLETGGGEVLYDVFYESDDHVLKIGPRSLLNEGGAYTLTVTSEATDTSGVALDQDPETAGDQDFILDFWVEDPPPGEGF